MNKYLQLLYFEVERGKTFYRLLVLFFIAIQIVCVFFTARSLIVESQQFVEGFEAPQYTISSIFSILWYPYLWLLVYLFFFVYAGYSWLREWLFKGQFANRLLTLPTSRFNLLLAKLSHLILMYLSLLFIQILMVYGTDFILGHVLNPTIYKQEPISYVLQFDILQNFVLPINLNYFFLIFIALLCVLSWFYLIMTIFISYRHISWQKVIVYIAGISLIDIGLFIISFGLYVFLPLIFSEFVFLVIIMLALIIILNFALTWFLLNHKVMV